ncbi:MAG: hypothetical protein ACPL3C_05190 [Pyrobaculum sp.]
MKKCAAALFTSSLGGLWSWTKLGLLPSLSADLLKASSGYLASWWLAGLSGLE